LSPSFSARAFWFLVVFIGSALHLQAHGARRAFDDLDRGDFVVRVRIVPSSIAATSAELGAGDLACRALPGSFEPDSRPSTFLMRKVAGGVL